MYRVSRQRIFLGNKKKSKKYSLAFRRFYAVEKIKYEHMKYYKSTKDIKMSL